MPELKDITIVIHARAREDAVVVYHVNGQYHIDNDAMAIASVVTHEGFVALNRKEDCHYGHHPGKKDSQG